MNNALETLENRRLMATLTVTSNADAGPGTLRDAINQANATPAADVVNFSIGSGAVGIGLFSGLTATNPITIDATTQPGYAGSPIVRLNDSNSVGFCLSLNGAGSVVRGLSITGFGNPATANDGTGVIVNATSTIEKCYIGLRPDGGSTANEGDGIAINAANTVILDNVISGNGKDGVQVNADYANFTGNLIGTDPTGSLARPNLANGIRVQTGFDAQVFGQDRLNVISGNGQAGILLVAGGARILSNHIGVTKSGNAILANGTYGVHISGSSGHLIGNANVGNRFGGSGLYITNNNFTNYVRHNTFGIGVNPIFDVGGSVGINIDQSARTEITSNTIGRVGTGIRVNGDFNKVQFNHVGITSDGAAIPNNLGITVEGQSNHIEPNDVSNNSTYGVWVIGGDKNVIRNQAWNNGQSVEVSAGANGNQPKADIQSITEQPDGSFVANVGGNFTVPKTYRFAFYSNDAAGNAASGDTQRFIVSIDFVVTNVGGQGFNATIPQNLLDGQYLTAQLMEVAAGGFNGTGGEPSIALKVVGRPAVYSTTFEYETQHAWSVQFSADVGASLNASDFSILNTDTNALFAASSVTWDSATKTAHFVRPIPLADGRYTASIKAGSVSSINGVNIGTFPQNFNSRRGDANRDGLVNFADLLILAQNYGTTGKTFSQGNFDYDVAGNVNFADLLLLAQRYGTPLLSASPIASRTSSRSPNAEVVG